MSSRVHKFLLVKHQALVIPAIRKKSDCIRPRNKLIQNALVASPLIPVPNEEPSAATTLLYCFFASSFCTFGFERQYALRLTVAFSSFLSATQVQFLPALHAASFFRELHVAHFSGGESFLSCAFDSFANVMTIATLPSVQMWLRTVWFMALLLASVVAPLPSVPLMHSPLQICVESPRNLAQPEAQLPSIQTPSRYFTFSHT